MGGDYQQKGSKDTRQSNLGLEIDGLQTQLQRKYFLTHQSSNRELRTD